MKRILIVIVSLLCTICAKAQTISGNIYSDSIKTAIAGASVYYSGSITGTITDKDGHFVLPVKAQQIPIVVSCIGYNSASATYQPGQPLIIYLKPKQEQLHTVTIRADGMDRDAEIALFKREFIGTSGYALSCVITNIDDIDFFYSRKTETLTASCDKPIIIENKKLGYTITYYLDQFKKAPNEVYFAGNYIFKENETVTASDQAKIKQNREDAYEGSRMQFIRALWNHTLKKTGFGIYTALYKRLTEDSIMVSDSLRQKYVKLNNRIIITHNSNVRDVTFLEGRRRLSFIDKNGFYGLGLQWNGRLTNQRIGDLLPFEYQSEKEQRIMGSPDVGPLEPPAMLITSQPISEGGYAPSDFTATNATDEILANSTPQNNQLIFEKTYLHTDRDVYAQGDTLWFKAYLLNAQDNKPIATSGTLYVELLAPDSARIINREIIRLENGLGNGDMELIDSLAPGKYRLRAYTNWMRNFSDNFVFEKNITILNTQAVPAAPEPKTTAKPKPATKSKTATATATSSTATIKLPVVRFYPEGGSLVEGISAMVGVKAEDGYGTGIPVKGAVLSSAGDTVSHFSCDSLGMGLLALLPVKGQTYHAVVDPVVGGLPFRHGLVFELPPALSKGLTLQIRQTDSVIRAIIRRSGDTANSMAKPHYAIVVKHAGKTLLNQQLQLQTNQGAANIATVLLPEGISAISLYDEQGKPQCERLVYVHHPGGVVKTTITTNKKIYQPKEQVTVNINTPPNASLSMAVVDADIVPEQADDIVSYLQLKSEVKGNIENARRYFDTTNVNRFKQLDLLLMTQGWRDFVWRRLADTAIRISYAIESGIAIPGRIWEEVRNKMLPGLIVSLHADGAKGNKSLSTMTDSAGRFHFDGLMLYGKQRLQLASINTKGQNKGTIWLDTIRPLAVRQVIARPGFLQNSLDSIVANAIEKKKEVMKTSKLFGVTKLKEVTIREKQTFITRSSLPLTTWGPNQIFNITPEDYQYKTLEWYLLQKVKGAVQGNVYCQDGLYTTFPDSKKDFTLVTGIFFQGRNMTVALPKYEHKVTSTLIPPMLIVNNQELYMDEPGQAEAYRNIYFPMPLNKFKKIEVKHMLGGVGLTDYFLLYLTMQDNYTIDNPAFLIKDITGYNEPRKFYEPLPNAKPSLADYRSTIHWEPNIKTDATGKATVSFYNALPQTDVRVIVEGITDKGEPVGSTIGYEVK